jgi:hypothetical protein
MNYRTIIATENLRAMANDRNGWAVRHCEAFDKPRGPEYPIINLLYALADLATEHESTYGSKIGDDGVLGEYWLQIARGLVGMLNGECGRLDCGTADRTVRALAKACGFDEKDWG